MPESTDSRHADRTRIIRNTLETAQAGLRLHAQDAMKEIADVAKEALPAAEALANDWGNDRLTADQAYRGLRKLELSVETAVARIAREEAKKAAGSVVGGLLKGALGILKTIF